MQAGRQGRDWWIWAGMLLLAALVLWTGQRLGGPREAVMPASLFAACVETGGANAEGSGAFLVAANADAGAVRCDSGGRRQDDASCNLASCVTSPVGVAIDLMILARPPLSHVSYRLSAVAVPSGLGISPSLPPPRQQV